MKPRRLLVTAGVAAVCATVLTGCAIVDAVVWGEDGAQVIRTTEELIQDLASGGTTDLLCDDAEVDLGAARLWAGRSPCTPAAG